MINEIPRDAFMMTLLKSLKQNCKFFVEADNGIPPQIIKEYKNKEI